MAGTILINENLCKGCELCTFVCPKHLIGIVETFTARGYHPARLFDPGNNCTGCLLCAVICPDVAITVYREDRRTAAAPRTPQVRMPQPEARRSE
jgi:2-oxoglutarate ferredoxin oxidoreductase subunit delta